MRMVTTLIPFRNGSLQWLRQSIESAQAQTCCNEVLVVDDNDPVRQLQDAWGAIILRSPKPGDGLAFALNHGLQNAKNDLVARLDADDYMVPGRLKLQADYMTAHPQCVVCGTGAWFENTTSGHGGQCPPLPRNNKQMIEWMRQKRCPFIHPATMLRRSLLPKGFYPTDFPHAEDLAGWSLLLKAGAELENLPELTTMLRKHPERASLMHSDEQKASSERVWKDWPAL
jgi:glycosyltransferase involved in cell wall biosynthesis